jgi:hypothetical protein
MKTNKTSRDLGLSPAAAKLDWLNQSSLRAFEWSISCAPREWRSKRFRLSDNFRGAHASRVWGLRLAIANFLKACFGETPQPTRETRALPGTPHFSCDWRIRQLRRGDAAQKIAFGTRGHSA